MGRLSPIYIPPSHFFVQPVVACCDGLPNIRLQEEEVAAVMWVPLSKLPPPGKPWPNQSVRVRGGKVTVPGWQVERHVLWGATAMMMAELLEVCELQGLAFPLHVQHPRNHEGPEARQQPKSQSCPCPSTGTW